jgi:hypothetical protein
MDSKILWEQLSFDTLKSLCQELGLNKPQAGRARLYRGHQQEWRLARFHTGFKKRISSLTDTVIPVESTDNDKASRDDDFDLFIRQYEEQEKAKRENEKEGYEALIKRTTDFWNGNISIDPALERFDTLDSLSIVVRQSGREHPWLQVG